MKLLALIILLSSSMALAQTAEEQPNPCVGQEAKYLAALKRWEEAAKKHAAACKPMVARQREVDSIYAQIKLIETRITAIDQALRSTAKDKARVQALKDKLLILHQQAWGAAEGCRDDSQAITRLWDSYKESLRLMYSCITQ